MDERSRRTTSERGQDGAAEKLSKFFRAASAESVRQGKARIFVEKAVSRAEASLLSSRSARGAGLDQMSLQPGSLLAKRDLEMIYEASECRPPRETATCSEDAQYRTIDGTCNNLANPLRGSSFTAFKRILPANFEDGLSQMRGAQQSVSEEVFAHGPFNPPYPSTRLVSSTVVRDRSVDDPLHTHLLMAFGQFLDHDMDLAVQPSDVECDLASCETGDLCAPVRVPTDDQTFGVGTARNGSCLPFVRSLPACTSGDYEARNPVNEISSFLDCSMIYGSTSARASFLREMSGGRLRAEPDPPRKPTLPKSPPCPPDEGGDEPSECCPSGQEFCYVAGDKRANEVTTLTVMHTLWLREHNRIADSLAALNPTWDDERLYQEARKIVWAKLQKITYYEYIPTIFGTELFRKLIGNYAGYDPEADASVSNAFATAAFRFGHSQIQPLFYRLDDNYDPIPEGHLSIVDAFFKPGQYNESGGTDPLTRGMVAQPAKAVDEFLTSSISKRLFETDGIGMDIATLNTMRGRDHGLHPYWVWKQFCKKKFGIESEFKNELTRIRLLQTYRDINAIDLWIGGLAEQHLEGAVVGATFACIMAIQFEDLRSGDRFYFEKPGVFRESQLKEIMKTSIARIICDNGDAITSIQMNPFEIGERVPCSAIPTPSLAPWQELDVSGFECHLKFQLQPNSGELAFFVKNRNISENAKWSRDKYTFPASGSTRFQCAPIVCPAQGFVTEVLVHPTKVPLRNECEHTRNAVLPESIAPASGSYRAFMDHGILLELPSSGVYTSEEDCNMGSDVFVTFVCPNPDE